MKNFRVAGVLAVILVVLGGLALWDDEQTKKDKKHEEGKNRLITLDMDSVVGLAFTNSPANSTDDDVEPGEAFSLRATRAAGADEWSIVEPVETEADAQTLKGLMDTLKDYKFEKELDVSREQWSSYGLNPPHRKIELTLTGQDEPTIIYIGNKAPVGYSVYAATNNAATVYVGSQYLKVSSNKTLKDFRRKDMLKVDESTVRGLVYRTGESAPISMEKKDGLYQIVSPEAMEADSPGVTDFLGEIGRMVVEEFADSVPPELASALSTEPYASLTLETTEGAQIAFAFAKYDDAIWAWRNGKGPAFRLPAESEPKLIKTLQDFRNRRVFAFNANDVTAVTIDGESYASVKNEWYPEDVAAKFEGDEWKGEGDAPQPLYHVRSLLVDFEFSNADEFLEVDSQIAKGLQTQEPKHRIKLAFQDESIIEVRAWPVPEGDNAGFYLEYDGGKHLYVVPVSTFDEVSEKASGAKIDELDSALNLDSQGDKVN